MRKITALIAGAAASALLAGAAQAQDTTIAWKGAPLFSNDTLTFKVRGRVYMDMVDQDVDFANPASVDLNTTTSRLRTARLGVEGTWNQNWSYKAEFSIVGADAAVARTQVNWEDLILEYKANDYTSIMLGNFKSTGFENVSSSRYTTFMERGPINDVMDNGRVMTAQIKMNGETWTASGFVHGDSVNNADPALGSSEQFGYGARATWAPVNGDTTKLFVGGSVRKRDRGQGATGAFQYRSRNNTNLGNRYVDTGAIGEQDFQLAAEGLFIMKNFSVQSEYANINVERANGVDHDLQAYYVAGSWFITGETRNLDVKKGELGRTRILNPMTAGGLGAFELAVRYDSVDLTEAFTNNVLANPAAVPPVVAAAAISPNAGEYSAFTVGLNWYPHPFTRFMINYTDSDNDLTPANVVAPAIAPNPDVSVKTLQFRAQFDF